MSFMEIEKEEPLVYPCLNCRAAAGQSCVPSDKNRGEVRALGYCFWRTRLSALHLCLALAKELNLPVAHLEDEIAAGPEALYKQLGNLWQELDKIILNGCGKHNEKLAISVANFIGNL